MRTFAMKKVQFILFVLAIGFLTFPANVQAGSVSPEKKAAIKKLLDLSGSDKISVLYAEMMSKSMKEMLKKSDPNIPEAALTAIDEELVAVFKEEMEAGSLYKMLYPIYDAKFSTEEIMGLVNFYETPLGQKVSREMPEISQQAMASGQKWGAGMVPKIQARIQKRLKAEGVVLK